MDIKELKENIKKSKDITLPLIFKYTDNKFLCEMYIDQISKLLSLEKCYIQSPTELFSADGFFNSDASYLYIYNVDVLEDVECIQNKNVIVVCNKIDKKLSVDYVDFPKLVDWQIEGYVQASAPGLSTENVQKLCKLCQYDIYRLKQECMKIQLFSKGAQENILKQMESEGNFDDLVTLNVFNFTNALIKKDLDTLKYILSDLVHIDVEGTGVVTILYKNFKNIINIKTNPKATPESLGLKSNQYNAIKWNCSKYSLEQLVKIFDFLTRIDARIKNGDLQFSDYGDEGNKHLINNNHLVDYLTTHFLTITL